MKTRAVFRILSGKVKPALLPLGFSPLKDPTGQVSAWTRSLAKKSYQTVWCQIDKNPWDLWIGFVRGRRSSRREPGRPGRSTGPSASTFGRLAHQGGKA